MRGGRGGGGRGGGRGRGGGGGGGEPVWMKYKQQAQERRAGGGIEANDAPPTGDADSASGSESGRADAVDRVVLSTRSFSLRSTAPAVIDVPSLREFFRAKEGGPYPALRDLKASTHLFDAAGHRCSLSVMSVQADPFAPPSQITVSVPFTWQTALMASAHQGVPPARSEIALRTVALQDYLLRELHCDWPSLGRIRIQRPSQHVLDRNALVLVAGTDGAQHLELRLQMPFLGHGRRIDGRGTYDLISRVLLPAAAATLLRVPGPHLDARDAEAAAHVTSVLDQAWVREQLHDRGLAGFVADGAVLPRAGGSSDLPMGREAAVPIHSPEGLAATFTLPFSGRQIRGLGIPRGVTALIGGAFHGKSTLLRALQVGIYDHVPGDGREFVCTDARAVKVRAEDRRAVCDTDISPFVADLPTKADTRHFTTVDASGSTSQAASTMEALAGTGARVLLVDEDTAATNFMVRDETMAKLIAAEKEPIRPFATRVRAVFDVAGASSIVVCGGTSQMLPACDRVIALDKYVCVDRTTEARELVGTAPAALPAVLDQLRAALKMQPAYPVAEALQASIGGGRGPRGDDRLRVTPRGMGAVSVGAHTVDLGALEQIVEEGQVNAIAACIAHLDATARGPLSLADVHRAVDSFLNAPRAHVAPMDRKAHAANIPHGFLARPRLHEAVGAVCRLRPMAMVAMKRR